MERDIIFIPFHFVESAANVLTNPAFDLIAKIREFKLCAVRIQRMDSSEKSVSSPAPAH
jgi:predicted molibdopterin-dependent oxidoreductase YjgC